LTLKVFMTEKTVPDK